MIKTHDFNSEWWGDRVGIIDDPSFFALRQSERHDRLAKYAWVEYVAPFDEAPLDVLTSDGFFQSDTQVPFKINLRRLPALPDFVDLDVSWATEAPFTLDQTDVAAFVHERYRYLPGITTEKLNERYARFGNALIAEHPEWCLRVWHTGREQGWFLCNQSEHGFGLTLAMLHSQADVSGMLLYHRALSAFAERGQTVGGARFSITNTAVHNIYASLGARFLAPLGCWLWISSEYSASDS
jgi:hypothetical protein